ncbi:motilin-like [Corythoichthys intestinalis]|uniref:motilin-like n=1 Tax=Corythoichthys intestinalis TaxID=161448 RepID=UPI0025A51D7D|nr:motilin-like [Corythoichthys intestinalis]
MSMRGAVVGCMVLTCLVALLVERTQGHITFFSPKEMSDMRMLKQREGRKDMAPRSEDGQCEEVAVQQLPQTEHGGKPDKTVDTTAHLSLKQLDQVAPVLEELIHEIVEQQQAK